jgi:hypothetical protein
MNRMLAADYRLTPMMRKVAISFFRNLQKALVRLHNRAVVSANCAVYETLTTIGKDGGCGAKSICARPSRHSSDPL